MNAACRVVFLHGAGRAGPANWPAQAQTADERFDFLIRDAAYDDATRDASRLVEAVAPAGHVVAHSYGAIAAMLAARTSPTILSLVLFEPACLSLARGRAGAEAHIASWSTAFDVAGDSDVDWAEWSRRFAKATGMPVPELPEAVLERETIRLRSTPPPWTIEVDAAVPGTVPTLVVTGGWDEAYEDVAKALVALGARHVQLVGHGHRPQDHDQANPLMRDHWAAAETAKKTRG